MSLSSYVQRKWYESQWGIWWLWPLMWLFGLIVFIRHRKYQQANKSWKASVPVIVVGNITVGGTGKTPLTLTLIEKLKEKGYRPGIVSRGYGGKSDVYPLEVLDDSLASIVGDEPLMLKTTTGCPVVVSPLRVDAVKYLLAHHDCNLIICDDGLQHYALQRDLEICVIDAQRGLGSAKLLPVGPLRERVSRLYDVDFVVENYGSLPSLPRSKLSNWEQYLDITQGPEAGIMSFQVSGVFPLATKGVSEKQSLSSFSGKTVHALAGIGHPERFFCMLEAAGLTLIRHPFPDHHAYRSEDICFDDRFPVVMTDKDAVKCQHLKQDNLFRVSIKAELDERFLVKIMDRISTF